METLLIAVVHTDNAKEDGDVSCFLLSIARSLLPPRSRLLVLGHRRNFRDSSVSNSAGATHADRLVHFDRSFFAVCCVFDLRPVTEPGNYTDPCLESFNLSANWQISLLRIPGLFLTGRCCRRRAISLRLAMRATSRAAASISSVSFDTYRYSQPAIYSPSAIARIVSAYKVAGWKHLVDNHGGNAISVETGQRRGTTTDLWLHFTGTDIDGVTVLARNPKDMNLVQGGMRP